MAPKFQLDLERLVISDVGPGHAVSICSPVTGGYAGLTWAFDLALPDRSSQSFILKMSPSGVARRGSTDIFRQAPLLQALHEAGQPVPSIRWASGGDEPLGAPFIVMERLAGRSLGVWEPHSSFLAEPGALPSLWLQTAAALGKLHGLDWTRSLRHWDSPVTLNDEFDRWGNLLRHAQDARWLGAADALLASLRRTAPPRPPIGVVHGDAQPSNAIFDDGRLVGLIDWDLAAIGPVGIDLGWLLMISDRQHWSDDWKPIPAPSRDELVNAYREVGGPVSRDVDWYQAFAHFRMAAITGLNLKLHRSGRRVDPAWERFDASLPGLLAEGIRLLAIR